MRPEKKQLEHLLIQYFRECYDAFPKGKIVASESPDFVLKIKSRLNVGIELTRMNPYHIQVQEYNEVEDNLLKEEIIQLAKELFLKSTSVNLFVKILFSEKTPVLKQSKLVVAAQLANKIREAVREKKQNGFYRESIPRKSLPNGLEEVLVLHHPKLMTSVWEYSNNLGISENVPEDIRAAIQKKDKKLNLYHKQRLNNYWLVITTDRLRGTKNYNLQNQIMNSLFHSKFQHVFLFDLMNARVFDLL